MNLIRLCKTIYDLWEPFAVYLFFPFVIKMYITLQKIKMYITNVGFNENLRYVYIITTTLAPFTATS